MWGSILALALLLALNPLRLGVTLLLISRPRPVQNLLAYWAGCVLVIVPVLVVPLTLLHITPMFKSFSQDLATSSTVRHIQFGFGVLLLSIAALMTVRSLTRPRQRAQLATPGGNASTLVLDSDTPNPISSPFGRSRDAATEGGSAIRRLLGRLQRAWDSGALWVAFVIGIGNMPTPDVSLFVLAIIATSGAAIGAQVSAAVVFVIGVLAVVEITLVSHLAMPVKTQAVLRLLHDWALARRRQIMVAMCIVAGVALVAHGAGIL